MYQSMAQLCEQDIKPWPKCTKTYNSRWEADPLLKTWIARHPVDVGKVVCRFCQSVIRAHKNDLLEHTRTLKHQRNFMAHASPEDYNQFVMELNELRKDAQVMTKRKSGGGQQQSQRNGKALNASHNVTSWPPDPLGPNNDNNNSGGIVGYGGSGGSGNESDANSYSADSPSDLVSVILEEQQADSPHESHNSTEFISSSHIINTNTLTPILNPNSTSPPHSNQYEVPGDANLLASGNVRLNLKPEPVTMTLESLPFTSSDIISAMEEDCFSLPELVAMAKCALDRVSIKLNTQCTLEQLSNSLHPPPVQPSITINSELTAGAHKSLNMKNAGKTKRKRKKSPESEDNSVIIKNEGGCSAFILA